MLSSLAIPYASHTCLKANHTEVVLLKNNIDCHHSDNNSCHSSENFDAKCCIVQQGIIQSHVQLIKNQLQELQFVTTQNLFVAFTPKAIFSKISQKTYPQLVQISSAKETRILYQSFLC